MDSGRREARPAPQPSCLQSKGSSEGEAPGRSDGNISAPKTESPPRLGEGLDFCMTSRLESPSYVKWDFDLPHVSEEVKKAAKELAKEMQELPLKRHKSVKVVPYHKKKTDGETPSKVLYAKSVRQLKEALGRYPTSPDVARNSPETVLRPPASLDPPRPEPLRERFKTVPDHGSSGQDLFDNSIDDFLNEFSEKVEKNFYNTQTTERSNASQDDSRTEDGDSSYTTKTNRTSARRVRVSKGTPRNLSLELDNIDDDLFLNVDL